tara:strand:- start:43 stop:1605 length:1563 start_codon:yes stop_codon:yes gene_type:complete
MADRISAFRVNCVGGMNTNRDVLSQGEETPGSATQLINYEPAITGGYRRLSGFTNSYGTVTGSGNILGVAIQEGINDSIFACRKPAPYTNTNYFYRWDAGTTAWVAVATPGSVTMEGVSKVRFTPINWGASKILLTDGINPAATYDGTTYTQITHANAPTAPKYASNYKNHLFLCGDPAEPYNLYFSAPVAETDFSAGNGAGVINMGFEVVQIKSFRDTLYIFGKNQIKKLNGNSSADFIVEEVTSNLGCLVPDSVVELGGSLIFLGPDGFRPISGTSNIGDVELQTISKQIQFTISAIIQEIVAGSLDPETLTSVVLRSKSQFRFFIPAEGTFGLLGGLRQTAQGFSFEYSQLFGIAATSAASGYIGVQELIVHGDSTGKVYLQESGQSFDGAEILSIYQTPYYYFEDPTVRKNFYNVTTFLRSEGSSEILLGVSYDFEDSQGVFNPANFTINTQGAAAFYNEAIYDAAAIYDGNPSPVTKTNISGSGFSVAFKYVTNDTNASHTIQGIVLNYAINDRR